MTQRTSHGQMLRPSSPTFPWKTCGGSADRSPTSARISHKECIGAADHDKPLCRNDFTYSSSAPMPTKCSRDFFGFAPVEGRDVVPAFDGGAITSNAGAHLLGGARPAIGMMQRLAACFHDERQPHLIEHEL